MFDWLKARHYELFLSHSWTYSDSFEEFKGVLDSGFRFKYSNHSVESCEPIDAGNCFLPVEAALCERISRSDIVIYSDTSATELRVRPGDDSKTVAQDFFTRSKWIDFELALAAQIGKPILQTGVKVFALTPGTVIDEPDARLSFLANNVVSAIKQLVKRGHYAHRGSFIAKHGAWRLFHIAQGRFEKYRYVLPLLPAPKHPEWILEYSFAKGDRHTPDNRRLMEDMARIEAQLESARHDSGAVHVATKESDDQITWAYYVPNLDSWNASVHSMPESLGCVQDTIHEHDPDWSWLRDFLANHQSQFYCDVFDLMLDQPSEPWGLIKLDDSNCRPEHVEKMMAFFGIQQR